MTTFDEREKAFEAKFRHDGELHFRIANRRNKLLGQWAAELLGLPEAEAAAYAKEVVLSDLSGPGDDDVHEKVFRDFQRRRIHVSAHRLRRKMDELLTVAHQQIMDETLN